MALHKYEMTVCWSVADKLWIVEVPQLRRCMAHGATPEKAIANVQKAITAWIATARDAGQAIPLPEPRVNAGS
jgi:predicted RNase H-like HicB family nuclease